MQQKRYAEACAKFAESQRLGPASGTLLNLGECHAKSGRTASAWAAFKEAIALAQSANQADREQYAKERVAEIEGSLVKLAVKVDPSIADTKGLVVKRDAIELGKASWGTAVPVDPGTHVIEATAPGKKTWTKTLDVGAEKLTEVTVTALDPEAPPSSGTFLTQKTIGLGVGGLGLVFLTVGTIFGISAIGSNSDAKDKCRTATLCTPEGLDLTDTAKSQATVSTVFFVLGTMALAGGAVLYFTAPKPAGDAAKTAWARGIRVVPALGPGSAGAFAIASF